MAYGDEARERDRAALAWWSDPARYGPGGWTARDAEIARESLRRRLAGMDSAPERKPEPDSERQPGAEHGHFCGEVRRRHDMSNATPAVASNPRNLADNELAGEP